MVGRWQQKRFYIETGQHIQLFYSLHGLCMCAKLNTKQHTSSSDLANEAGSASLGVIVLGRVECINVVLDQHGEF